MDRPFHTIRTTVLTFAAALFAAVVCPAATNDWPCWRGPAANGISDESGWNPQALTNGIPPAWRVSVGAGYAAVSVQDGKLFTAGNVDDKDIVLALDAKTGKELWRHTYPCGDGSYPGPRATPMVADGRVYAFSREGEVFCLNEKNGAVLWRHDVTQDPGAGNIGWGFASSPVTAGNLLLLNAGETGVALDRRTGKTVWGSEGKGGYSTPAIYDSAAERCVALFSQKFICGVRLADGKELWRFPWKTSYDVNAADPIVSSNRVFVSSGYDKGCALLDIARNKPAVIWQNKSMRNHFSSCVLIDGFLYGIDGNVGEGTLRCLALENGAERWSRTVGFGALVAVDGKLVALNERGDLLIVAAKPAAYVEIARADGAVPVGKGEKCWTMPVFCRGFLYCRTSGGTLVSFDLSK